MLTHGDLSAALTFACRCVQNSVFESVDAVCLGAETASGDFPVEATQTMAHILADAEQATNYYALHSFIRDFSAKPFATIDAAACCLARTSMDTDIGLTVTFSASGSAAAIACKYRPSCTHVVVTSDPAVAASCSLFFGMLGCLWPDMSSLAKGVDYAVQKAKDRKLYVSGRIAVMHGSTSVSADSDAALTVM
jgi:pyruvate kinase